LILISSPLLNCYGEEGPPPLLWSFPVRFFPTLLMPSAPSFLKSAWEFCLSISSFPFTFLWFVSFFQTLDSFSRHTLTLVLAAAAPARAFPTILIRDAGLFTTHFADGPRNGAPSPFPPPFFPPLLSLRFSPRIAFWIPFYTPSSSSSVSQPLTCNFGTLL